MIIKWVFDADPVHDESVGWSSSRSNRVISVDGLFCYLISRHPWFIIAFKVKCILSHLKG
ncbi:hypothetical protein Tph_c16740 [Thermacetogenium phaeum DSM 12270]|uniref:Uncharacterized protein n=1 Tax=Thermacetogenium phaeum (strain ATCC BAA-254 / DSM 26808 / PB) TaxID=1089553 RepID=K4LV29_THEPS|nr:hypothetical protein Tph_c16740 [Thermacetogenium phaeum DSM 12270]